MQRVTYGYSDLPTCIVCGRRITTKKYNHEFCSMKCKDTMKYHNHSNMKEVAVLMRQYHNGGLKGY